MSEYRPELPRLKENLRKLADAYSDFHGVNKGVALTRVLGTPMPRIAIFDPDADIKAGKYDAWVQKFSNVWPAALPWPADVPRPTVVPAADD